MSSSYIPSELRRQVLKRDRGLCCYCKSAQKIVGAEFTIDHIVPESIGGPTQLHNLCLACWRCNLIKGDRIVAKEPNSDRLERLYHPVNQLWNEHFAWRKGGSIVLGLTPTGRATVQGLRLNRPVLVESRKLWTLAGWHPPQE